MVDRLSSLDAGYQTGDLSIYPEALDTKITLFEVRNNAETVLTQSINYSSRWLVVESTNLFPPKGIIRCGTELIYYNKKTANTFQDLKRGYAGTRQNPWTVGTVVGNVVAAEHHNAIKDAVINIESNLGTIEDPTEASLNGILKSLENKFLAPKPVFVAAPIRGKAPLKVRFQHFSGGDIIRFLWDFGDGGTSVDITPEHTYLADGVYTVKLNVITVLGAQGIVTKTDYIRVDSSTKDGYCYVTPQTGTTTTEFLFVDQTAGEVASRYWIFDDGTTLTELDPDVHTATHTYSETGTYNASLIIVFSDQSVKRILIDSIVIH